MVMNATATMINNHRGRLRRLGIPWISESVVIGSSSSSVCRIRPPCAHPPKPRALASQGDCLANGAKILRSNRSRLTFARLMIGQTEIICCPKLNHLGKKGAWVVLAVYYARYNCGSGRRIADAMDAARRLVETVDDVHERGLPEHDRRA
jgi:hypothetical protein